MDTFLTRPQAQRRSLCEEAGVKLGLDALSVEKDFWVCWTLRELFGLAEISLHLTFKGGTSLSKAWKLIERFSEDLDIVIDRAFLGFGGDQAPEAASSNKQREQRLQDLKAACQALIRQRLQPALAERLHGRLSAGLVWALAADPADVDQQTLLFQYPTVSLRCLPPTRRQDRAGSALGHGALHHAGDPALPCGGSTGRVRRQQVCAAHGRP